MKIVPICCLKILLIKNQNTISRKGDMDSQEVYYNGGEYMNVLQIDTTIVHESLWPIVCCS